MLWRSLKGKKWEKSLHVRKKNLARPRPKHFSHFPFLSPYKTIKNHISTLLLSSLLHFIQMSSVLRGRRWRAYSDSTAQTSSWNSFSTQAALAAIFQFQIWRKPAAFFLLFLGNIIHSLCPIGRYIGERKL